MKNLRAEELKREYSLEEHSEGGWFSEVYTAPFEFEKDNRTSAGSIYFLLDGEEISHFHQIDCDEIWHYHEGCGMKITILKDDTKQELFLGSKISNGEKFIIPKGAIFAAENLEKDKFTFISCATTPKFKYEGFRLVLKTEIRAKYPLIYDEIEHLAY